MAQGPARSRDVHGETGPGAAGAWATSVAEIIAGIGSPDLPHRLDLALKGLAPFDLSVIFAYPTGNRPLYLHDGFGAHRPGEALQNYLDGAYLLDPFYVACGARPEPSGLYRMRDLAPDAFFDGHYVNNWEVHPCISMQSGSLAEEIGYVVPLPGGVMAVYSLMRSAGAEPFDDEEFDRLKQAAPIVREAMRAHWRELSAPANAEQPVIDERNPDVALERAFAGFCADLLSTRERMVTQMVLRGHSSHSIAANLGIAEGTVKNHRKSIYAKLAIATQQELFSMFLGHILAARKPGDR